MAFSPDSCSIMTSLPPPASTWFGCFLFGNNKVYLVLKSKYCVIKSLCDLRIVTKGVPWVLKLSRNYKMILGPFRSYPHHLMGHLGCWPIELTARSCWLSHIFVILYYYVMTIIMRGMMMLFAKLYRKISLETIWNNY